MITFCLFHGSLDGGVGRGYRVLPGIVDSIVKSWLERREGYHDVPECPTKLLVPVYNLGGVSAGGWRILS